MSWNFFVSMARLKNWYFRIYFEKTGFLSGFGPSGRIPKKGVFQNYFFGFYFFSGVLDKFSNFWALSHKDLSTFVPTEHLYFGLIPKTLSM